MTATEARKQTLNFTVGFGDWSDDGHGKLEIDTVQIFSTSEVKLTPKLLKSNYLANASIWGTVRLLHGSLLGGCSRYR